MIVVIGTGRMGGAFATAFAKRTSHTVSIRGSHAGSSSAAALSHQLGRLLRQLACDCPALKNGRLRVWRATK